MVKVQQYDTISSPVSMSHYTKYVQSLLTGDFKVLNVIFKSKFRVKDKTKELCFFDYFYRCFPQKNVRVWEKKRNVDENEYRPS